MSAPTTAKSPELEAYQITRRNSGSMFEALFSLSQTQRRLSHRQRRDALQYVADGNLRLYGLCMVASTRYWTDAKWHLNKARDYRAATNHTEH